MVEELGRRERKRLDTRRRLTRAALNLFIERGFDATTVDDIAEAADFHRATFFRVFDSKEDVLLGDIIERLEDLRAVLGSAVPAEDPWPIVRRILTAEATDMEGGDDELDPLRVTLLTQDPALQPRFTAMTLDWERAVAEFLAQCRGADPATDITSRVISTAMIGVVRTAMLAAPVTDRGVRDLLDEGFDLLEAGGLAAQVRTESGPR